MTMGFKVTGQVLGAAEVKAKFARAGITAHDAIRQAVQRLGMELLARVKADKLSGQVLNVKTGRLRRSINMQLDDQQRSVYAYVGTNVKYARIHERGGTINIPEITAKNAKALHFVMGGQDIFVKRVKAHSVTMPQRSFLQSALDDIRPEVASRLQAALVKALKEA